MGVFEGWGVEFGVVVVDFVLFVVVLGGLLLVVGVLVDG